MPKLSKYIDMKDVGNRSNLKALNTTELSNVLESYKNIKRDGGSPTKDCYVLNIGGTTAHYNLDYSPCLTRSRCGSRGYWLSWLSRKMTVKEMWQLQGLPPRAFPKDVVSDAQLGKIIGNAISIPVLAALMQNMMTACSAQ